MVPKAGLEPARLSPLPPQDSVSTKFHHFGTRFYSVSDIIPSEPVFQAEAFLPGIEGFLRVPPVQPVVLWALFPSS